MMRRTIAILAGVLLMAGLAMLPSTAGAQSPPEVLPTEEVPTETETETETETVTEAVQPVAVDRAPQVAGVQTQRPLPRTGNDIGGTVILGLALTGAGIALALGARKRRNSFDGV